MKHSNKQKRLKARQEALEAFKRTATAKAAQRVSSGGYTVPGSLKK